MTEMTEAAPSPGGRRRWRRGILVWGLPVLGVALLSWTLWPVVSGHANPPTFTRASAKKALDDARKSPAPRWAAASLAAAETAWRASEAEFRRQEVSILPLRDFRRARRDYEDAERLAKRAADEGTHARVEARAAADREMTESGRAVETCQAIGDAMSLARYDRALLTSSSIAMNEARYLFARDEFPAAAERARQAAIQAKRVTDRAVQNAQRFAEPRLIRTWQRQVEDTVAWSGKTGSPAIVVLKENHRLDLYDGGRLVRSYAADMGYRSFNDKMRAGDAATPEGRYHIVSKRGPGDATYYRAFDLDYPNADDRTAFERLKRTGQIPRGARLGGSIQIHGEGGRGKDWTRGCIALKNNDMDDLFRRVGIGTPVTIVGGDGRGVFTEIVRQHRSSAPATGTQ